MPELPEVETTRQGISPLVTGQRLLQLILHRPDLRWPIPIELPQILTNHIVLECARRGKYLLLYFEHGIQIIHLGMSGSLRSVQANEPLRTHDHVEWVFSDTTLRLHDPRRFGAVLWHPKQKGPINTHPLLAKLGREPFDPELDAVWLHHHLRQSHTTIKQILLTGKLIVGVGNIYASESLFHARIHPLTIANILSLSQCKSLIAAIRKTLSEALLAGGSTLRDYVNAANAAGQYFTIFAAVYGRANLPCPVCTTPIRRMMQNQRATYYCERCQNY